jgi:hypothetical protein
MQEDGDHESHRLSRIQGVPRTARGREIILKIGDLIRVYPSNPWSPVFRSPTPIDPTSPIIERCSIRGSTSASELAHRGSKLLHSVMLRQIAALLTPTAVGHIS